MIILGMFFGLGAYLRTIGMIFGPLSMVLGLILSLVAMFFFYFWKEGRKRVEFVVKKELAEEVKKKNFKQQIQELNERLKYSITFLKRVNSYRKQGHSWHFSFQLVYVEQLRKAQWKEPKNSIDFSILKEVKLDRNEYDEGGNKRFI